MNDMISLFPNYSTTDSIFQKMVTLGAPWSQEEALSMDFVFFTMYSGIKVPSMFTRSNISSSGEINSQTIATTLWNLYGKNWKRLWDALNMQYNPIDNYNVTETVTRDQTDDRTIGRNTDYTSSVDRTDTVTHGHQIQNNNFGFNSPDPVPSSQQVNSGDDIDVSNSARADKTAEDTTDNSVLNETLSRNRSGNVGQNSYQELIRQELELWKWNFFYTVFDDCDKVLCLAVFDPCNLNPVN